jgi:replication factor C small subunit
MNDNTRNNDTSGSKLLWIEKYRPQKLQDIIGQDSAIERLRSYVVTGNLPHLLFTGNAGIGKTTAAVALAKEFFHDDWQANFKELNASDERGIDIVRNTIKQFSRNSPMGGADFKILFLDEADALTMDAQSALRRTMEECAETCRFILSCNYSSKIIDPIQSRCAIYRFKPLDGDAIRKEISGIALKEGITITEGGMVAIVYVAQGDMRKAINTIQGCSVISKEINESHIYALTATARPEEILNLLALAFKGEFEQSEELMAELLYKRGIAPNELLNQLYRTLVAQKGMDKKLKVQFIDAIGETDFRLSEGANSGIQMEAMIARFVLAAEKWKVSV